MREAACSITPDTTTFSGLKASAAAMIRRLFVHSVNVSTLMSLFRSMPASGAEYKIQMCRSTSATGGFVDASGVACTASGGTTLLASHGDVYGPGGQ